MPPKRSSSMLLALSLCIPAAWGSGCARTEKPIHVQTPREPVAYDEAQVLRDWPRTDAYYADGVTVAGGVWFPYRYEPVADPGGRAENLRIVVDPAFFVFNLAAAPVFFFVDPPYRTRNYEGVIVPATYTAAVPLDEFRPGPSDPPIDPDAPPAPTPTQPAVPPPPGTPDAPGTEPSDRTPARPTPPAATRPAVTDPDEEGRATLPTPTTPPDQLERGAATRPSVVPVPGTMPAPTPGQPDFNK